MICQKDTEIWYTLTVIHEQVKDTEMSYIKIYLYKSENKTILFSNNFGFNDDFRVSL